MDCRNVSDSAKMATELYTQVITQTYFIYQALNLNLNSLGDARTFYGKIRRVR